MTPFSQKVKSVRSIITIGLFLIGSLHTMIFAIFQIPENFLMGRDSMLLTFTCKVVLYVFAIGTSLAHQLLCRKLGLRKALYFGLLCNFFGVSTLFVNQFQGMVGIIPLIFLDMVFFGMALTSVINALVTYIIIEFPKRVGIAVVILFAFFNLGAMLAPVFQHIGTEKMYVILAVLLILSIWFVHTFFFDAPVSKQPHLKKGSLIWKQLHYRLLLFVIAIIAYSLTETTFNLWTYIDLQSLFGTKVADDTIPFFWMFLIIGQVVLLIPLYFFPAKRVFYFLVLVIMTAAFTLPIQENLIGIIGWLAVAGFGCSAVFPILLSQMEKEMLPFARGKKILPYIEKSISLMFAGYFTGVGIIDLWVLALGKDPILTTASHFHLAAVYIGITGTIALFLDITTPELK